MIDLSLIAQRLEAEESKVPYVYTDSEGYLTIGIGRLVDQRKGGGLSDDEIYYLLRNDIHRATAVCENRFSWFRGLDDVRQAVIVCMAFQLGADGVAAFHQMIMAVVQKDWDRAAEEMKDSDWHKQTQARCERMATIMATGVWQ